MVNTFDGSKAAHLLPRQKNHVQVLWMGYICPNWLNFSVQKCSLSCIDQCDQRSELKCKKCHWDDANSLTVAGGRSKWKLVPQKKRTQSGKQSAPGILTWSPTTSLTRQDNAWLHWPDKKWNFHCSVDDSACKWELECCTLLATTWSILGILGQSWAQRKAHDKAFPAGGPDNVQCAHGENCGPFSLLPDGISTLFRYKMLWLVTDKSKTCHDTNGTDLIFCLQWIHNGQHFWWF